jgi:hypothetical protein
MQLWDLQGNLVKSMRPRFSNWLGDLLSFMIFGFQVGAIESLDTTVADAVYNYTDGKIRVMASPGLQIEGYSNFYSKLSPIFLYGDANQELIANITRSGYAVVWPQSGIQIAEHDGYSQAVSPDWKKNCCSFK